MTLHFSKITRPSVCLKNTVTSLFLTGKGSWVLASPLPPGVAGHLVAMGSYLGTHLRKASSALTSLNTILPSAFHSSHEILTAGGLQKPVSLCS